MLPPVTPMEIQWAILKATGHMRGVKFHCPEISFFSHDLFDSFV